MVKVNYKSNLKPYKTKIDTKKLSDIVDDLVEEKRNVEKDLKQYGYPLTEPSKLYFEGILFPSNLVKITSETKKYVKNKKKISKKDIRELIGKDYISDSFRNLIEKILRHINIKYQLRQLKQLDTYIYNNRLLLLPSMNELGSLNYKMPDLRRINKIYLNQIIKGSKIEFKDLLNTIFKNIFPSRLNRDFTREEIMTLNSPKLEKRKGALRQKIKQNDFEVTTYLGRNLKTNKNKGNRFNQLNMIELKANQWEFIHLQLNILKALREKNLLKKNIQLITLETIYLGKLNESEKEAIDKALAKNIGKYRHQIKYKINIWQKQTYML